MDAKSMNLENRKAEEVKKVLLYQIYMEKYKKLL